MSFTVTGTVEKVLPIVKGESKNQKEWQKVSFVLKTNEDYDNLYCFELFGEEKVAMVSSIKVSDQVEVLFNVRTNEYQGKFYTSLSAWKVSKKEGIADTKLPDRGVLLQDEFANPDYGKKNAGSFDAADDLPF